jgi:hypothetical protein
MTIGCVAEELSLDCVDHVQHRALLVSGEQAGFHGAALALLLR